MRLVLVESGGSVWVVELGGTADEDVVIAERAGEALPPRPRPVELLPAFVSESLVDVDALGPVVVMAVDRRPPLLVSADAGRTWVERGGGLPRGRAVALGETPDDVLYAARNRLYVSSDGGVFWRAVGVELPEIAAIDWA
jgi:hypothetical protein